MIDGYDLDRDLSSIRRALSNDMPEAAIFYCGRALEVTSAQAITALNLDPGNQVFANLDMLERLSCITPPARCIWGMRCGALQRCAPHPAPIVAARRGFRGAVSGPVAYLV